MMVVFVKVLMFVNGENMYVRGDCTLLCVKNKERKKTKPRPRMKKKKKTVGCPVLASMIHLFTIPRLSCAGMIYLFTGPMYVMCWHDTSPYRPLSVLN